MLPGYLGLVWGEGCGGSTVAKQDITISFCFAKSLNFTSMNLFLNHSLSPENQFIYEYISLTFRPKRLRL